MPNKNFVIKNGLEVDTDLIFADVDSNKVGIGTTQPNTTLDVSGDITGQNLTISGSISIGGSSGATNQLIVRTSYGSTYITPSFIPRESTVYTAGIGSTSFSVDYTVGLVDVYINGLKIPPSEFAAATGTTVVLNDPCFGGETVELVVYNPIY